MRNTVQVNSLISLIFRLHVMQDLHSATSHCRISGCFSGRKTVFPVCTFILIVQFYQFSKPQNEKVLTQNFYLEILLSPQENILRNYKLNASFSFLSVTCFWLKKPSVFLPRNGVVFLSHLIHTPCYIKRI